MLRFLAALAAVLCIATISGCQREGYSELGLVEVTGTVTLDGKPLPSAKVRFEGDDKSSAIGTTDAAGHYQLMYDSQTRGCTPGAKVVRITLAEVGEGGGAAEGAAVAKEPIPARYNRRSISI
jgi:hypothetical protein